MRALILIDIQNDFMPWGSVGIEKSDEVIPIANSLMEQFDLVIATQDWHPANHKCFAANHPWRLPGQVMEINGLPQLLWTIHCVQDSLGAELVNELATDKVLKIIQKGTNLEVDSYSAFFENDRLKSNGLEEYLKEKGIKEVFITGLAAEFGVKHSAIHAAQLGLKTNVIIDACRWSDASKENINKNVSEMESSHINIVYSTAFDT